MIVESKSCRMRQLCFCWLFFSRLKFATSKNSFMIGLLTDSWSWRDCRHLDMKSVCKTRSIGSWLSFTSRLSAHWITNYENPWLTLIPLTNWKKPLIKMQVYHTIRSSTDFESPSVSKFMMICKELAAGSNLSVEWLYRFFESNSWSSLSLDALGGSYCDLTW